METLHPVAAHFAVVLPLVALILQLTSMVTKQMILARASTVTLLVATVMVGFAYLSGSNDASTVVAEILSTYSPDGIEELKEHAAFGFNILVLIGVVLALKMVNCKLDNKILGYIVLIGMLASTAGMFIQGKHGGEVVYKYGTLFESYAIKDTLTEALTDVEDEDDADKAEFLNDSIKESLGMEEE